MGQKMSNGHYWGLDFTRVQSMHMVPATILYGAWHHLKRFMGGTN
jgi:hypothetical protein